MGQIGHEVARDIDGTAEGGEMTEDRVPGETFSPGEFIQDQLDARGWTTADLALRMGGNIGDIAINQLSVELMIAVKDKNLVMDREAGEGLARGFGTSVEYWENLDRIWRRG